MFAYVKNGQFQYLIPEGTPFEIDGVQYPANWLNLSTPLEKIEAGIVDVRYGDYPNDQYYWVSQDAPVYSTKFQEVYIGYTATPKDLFMLQNDAVTTLQQQAYSILQPSDWRVVKGYETKSVIPTDWNDWRAQIRSQCDAQITAVSACTTVEELAKLPSVDWAHDPNYIQPEA